MIMAKTSKDRLFGPRPAIPPSRKSTPTYRPTFDGLEDRCLPSLTVPAGFSASTFAPTPPASTGVNQLKPGADSIAVDSSGEHVFVGYNNGTPKDSTDPTVLSTIVEYSDTGKVLHSWQVQGHNDGLKIDPETGKVWALQNEDGNPNLVVINPETFAAKEYFFPTPDNGANPPNPPAPGGFDDITFLHDKIYMTESNPAGGTGSAVVQVRLPNDDDPISNQVVIVRTVLPLTTTATNSATGQTESLVLTDPDSMTAQGNNLVFTSQADDEIITIHNPGKHQFVTVVHVHDASGAPVEVDDTLFTPSAHGDILVVDTAGTVYEISGSAVKNGLVLSSGDLTNTLGTLDPKTGLFTPLITGFVGEPKGIAFLPTFSPDDGSGGDNNDGHEDHHEHHHHHDE
jgi:hypothetical protein